MKKTIKDGEAAIYEYMQVNFDKHYADSNIRTYRSENITQCGSVLKLNRVPSEDVLGVAIVVEVDIRAKKVLKFEFLQ